MVADASEEARPVGNSAVRPSGSSLLDALVIAARHHDFYGGHGSPRRRLSRAACTQPGISSRCDRWHPATVHVTERLRSLRLDAVPERWAP